MTRKGHIAWGVLLAAALAPSTASAQEGCLNDTRYPADAITPDRMGAVTTISTCTFQREYSQVTGVRATGEYQFAIEQGGYITVREGALGGPVLAHGTSPVTVTAQTTADLYPHWNTNAACGTSSNCVTTTVQLRLNCTLPEATFSAVEDCDMGMYTVVVNVASLGDGPSVDVLVDRGGDVEAHSGVGLGALEVGPFFMGEMPTVTVAHASDQLCDLELGIVEPFSTCPIYVPCDLSAPEMPGTYCYGNGERRTWLYHASGSGTMRLRFHAGGIASAAGDSLRIHDGEDASAPLLFEHRTTATTDLSGLVVFGTSGSIFMEMVSNGSVSCVDGSTGVGNWEWGVACSDCTVPEGTAVRTYDCDNNTFEVVVDITSIGTAPSAAIEYVVNGVTQTLVDLQVGETVVGPFQWGDTVSVRLRHAFNTFCMVDLGRFQSPDICPERIPCGAPALEETYCYSANENQRWLYRLTGGTEDSRLRLSFVRGTIESSTYDRLRIFDGPDETYPELFAHTATARRHLGPEGSAIADAAPVYSTVEVAATGEYISMLLTSDGSVQCGGAGYDEWEWLVYCVNCDDPAATFSVTSDCSTRGYSVQVDITDAGGDDALSVANLSTGQVIAGLGVGSHTFGPYPLDSVSVLRVYNEVTEMCRTSSGPLVETSTDCIDVTCGIDHHTYCYGNDEDRWYTYRGVGNRVMNVLFTAGELLAGDRISLYNGLNGTADLLYEGNNGGSLADLVVMSFAPNNAITLRIRSNGTGSCDDGGTTTPLQWTVSCGGVGIDELEAGAFTMFPNPTSGLLTIQAAVPVTKAQVRVLDMSGRVVMDQPLTMNGGDRNTIDMSRLQNGNYMVQVITTDGVMTKRVEVIR